MTDIENNVDALLEEELVLSKVEAGRRQLDSAIKMFFSDFDPVATHTVVAAAYDLLRGLCQHAGKRISVKDSPLIQESRRKEYIKEVNRAQNFFKHSERDPTSKLLFRPKVSALFILDAVIQYTALGGHPSRPMRVFLLWAQLMFPNVLGHLPTEEKLCEVREFSGSPEEFKVLAKILLTQDGEKS